MELTFILTEDCNLRCKYCYQKHFRPNRMGAETAVTAIRSAVDHGADSLSLTFFGGEPLLEAETLFEVMQAARAIEAATGVLVTAKVTTNGLRLNERVVRDASHYRVFISLSFDGVQAAQDAGRVKPDGQGSFAEAERALNVLVAANRPFAVYSVVTPQNVDYLAASRKYLWHAGARIIINAIDYTADWDQRAIRKLQTQYRVIGRLYRKLLKRREDFHLEPFDSRISQWTRATAWNGCSPGISAVTVAPDGTLYGCVEYFYRRMNPIGTASDWLDHDRVKELSQQRSGAPDECHECGVRDRCNNTCACVNLRTTGQVNAPPPSLCLTEQATILTIDQVGAKLFDEQIPGFILKHYSQSYHMLSGIEKYFESLEVENESPHSCA